MAVGSRDPLTTVVQLLSAQARGQVPVVVDEHWDDDAVRAVLEQAAHLTRLPDPHMVVHTSGSSARPRAVVRTVASWQTSLPAVTTLTGVTAQDVVWAPGGLASTLTLFAVWHALATGVPVVAGGRWDPAAVPSAATIVHCVPAVMLDVLQARREGRLPHLRRAVVAGAGGARALRRAASAAGVDVVEYYGAAELSFVAVDPDGSGLRPFPGVEVVARHGVLWSRSPYSCRGYLTDDPDPTDHPDHTDRTDRPLRRDPAGWLSVGDRGSVHADGTLVVEGREDGLSVGGHIVIVSDVEAMLSTVEGVAEVVCLGEPHARLGERVVAVVRPRTGHDPVPAMRRLARTALAPAARPVRYVVLSELPRTAGGKVARSVLRERVTTAGRPTRPGSSPSVQARPSPDVPAHP